MRELKFRAWDQALKQMTYVRRIDFPAIGSEVIPRSTSGEPIDGVLLQFTGLKDKNGVEIYEGDILVSHDRDANGPLDTYRFVEWSDSYGGWVRAVPSKYELYNSLTHTSELEVIGNIYENPELVE